MSQEQPESNSEFNLYDETISGDNVKSKEQVLIFSDKS
jgi:hypothetical protein